LLSLEKNFDGLFYYNGVFCWSQGENKSQKRDNNNKPPQISKLFFCILI
jgi:hypothetical protein